MYRPIVPDDHQAWGRRVVVSDLTQPLDQSAHADLARHAIGHLPRHGVQRRYDTAPAVALVSQLGPKRLPSPGGRVRLADRGLPIETDFIGVHHGDRGGKLPG